MKKHKKIYIQSHNSAQLFYLADFGGEANLFHN